MKLLRFSIFKLSLFAIFWSLELPLLAQSLEQNVLAEYKKDSLNFDFIKALSAIDSTITIADIDSYKVRLNSFLKTLPPKEEKAKREKKRVQKIYNNAHDYFFKKYEDLAYFPQIFQDGVYNCVTASALYAYIFDELEIPYSIKDEPGHVYLIAYPKTQKIILETTAPGVYGFRAPKDSEVQDNVEQLVALKLVTPDEVRQKGESKVFMDYFYGKESVEKAALIGMQYYNQALTNTQKENNKLALSQIKKSLIFYPYIPSKVLYKGLMALSLSELEFNAIEDIEYLVDMFNTLEYGEDYTDRDVDYYLYKITEHDDNDRLFISEAAKQLEKIKIINVKSRSKEMLFEYIARKSADRAEADEALKASDSILKYNPKSKIAKDIVAYALARKMSTSRGGEEMAQLNVLYHNYDFLAGNIKIESMRAYLFGLNAQNSFRAKNAEMGLNYLDSLEKLYKKYGDDLQVNPEMHAQLYLQAGRYYYGKSRNKKAYDIFTRGLKYNPNHSELKRMQKWAKEDMN